MKKIITMLIMLSIVLTFLSACSGDDTSSSGNDTNQTICEQLDVFADKSYKSVNLCVVTTTKDDKLQANYVLTQDSVSYSVENLNTLPTNGDLTGISPEYKSTYEGTAKIVGGKITELDGDDVSLPSYDELKGNFNFDESNLTNVVVQGNKLTADAISPASFLGSMVDAQDVKIEVEYTASSLSKVTITYQTAKSTVLIRYEFTI